MEEIEVDYDDIDYDELDKIMKRYESISNKDDFRSIFIDINECLGMATSKPSNYFFKKYFFLKSDYTLKDILFFEDYFETHDNFEEMCNYAIKECAYHFVDLFITADFFRKSW